MHHQSETAGLAGRGGSVVSKAVAAQNYQIPTDTANPDFAVRKVAERLRLTFATSAEVCRMAGVGGTRR